MVQPDAGRVKRGPQFESRHRGAARDRCGGHERARARRRKCRVSALGVKALQAIPLVRPASRQARFDRRRDRACLRLAFRRAEHVKAARHAAKAGQEPPASNAASMAPRRGRHAGPRPRGRHPSALHNNCSGKHAASSASPAAWTRIRKARRFAHRCSGVRASLEDFTGASHGDEVRGVALLDPDLRGAAAGPRLRVCQVGTGRYLARLRDPAERMRRAVAAKPFMVAGTGRFDTLVMEALRESVFVKTEPRASTARAAESARHRREVRRRRKARRRGHHGVPSLRFLDRRARRVRSSKLTPGAPSKLERHSGREVRRRPLTDVR